MKGDENTDSTPSLDGVFGRYAGEREDLISILQDIQERDGYLSRSAMEACAKFLRIPESAVYGVVTFYAAFSLKPRGKYRVSACLGTACHVRGAARIVDRLERELGIKTGETTPDRLFSLESVRCLGCCGRAPVLTVNEKVHGNVTTDAVAKMLDGYRAAAGPK